MINTNYKNFAPRIGVAYSPSDKWSVRTGIGMFYSQESKNSIFDMNRGLGGRTGNVASPAYLPPTFTYSNFINTAALPVTLPVGLTWGANPHLPTTYSMQYLLNIQRTLGKSTTLEVGYNGSQSRHLDHLINQNQPVLNASLPYVSRLPYPEFGASGIQWLNADSNGNYNGMSAKLTQRLGNNLNTLIAYTWSRSLDDSSAIRGTGNDFSPENALCPNSCEYGPSAFNVKHRFVASILYSLPFGKGMKFLNHGGVVNEVVGGWQFSTIATLQSGIPTETTSWDSGQTDAVPPSSRLNCTGLNPNLCPASAASSAGITRRRSATPMQHLGKLWPQQPVGPAHREHRFFGDQVFPHQRPTECTVPRGNVQCSQPCGIGCSQCKLEWQQRGWGGSPVEFWLDHLALE